MDQRQIIFKEMQDFYPIINKTAEIIDLMYNLGVIEKLYDEFVFTKLLSRKILHSQIIQQELDIFIDSKAISEHNFISYHYACEITEAYIKSTIKYFMNKLDKDGELIPHSSLNDIIKVKLQEFFNKKNLGNKDFIYDKKRILSTIEELSKPEIKDITDRHINV